MKWRFCVYIQPDFPEVGFVCHIPRLFPEEQNPAVGERKAFPLFSCTVFEEKLPDILPLAGSGLLLGNL